MAMVKSNGHVQGLEFNPYACFSIRGDRTILAEF